MSRSRDAQLDITGFWNTVAPDYEAHAGNVAQLDSPAYQHWRDALAAMLPRPPADVLDVATGTGYVALAAASLGHRVTAIDMAPAMLDALAAHADARARSVDARLGDAVTPPFPSASFDVVISRNLLWTLREPALAMTNWRTLLRPGGRLVAIDGFWFAAASLDDVPELFARSYDEGTRSELPFMQLSDTGPILAVVTAAGFTDVSATPRPDLDVGAGVPYVVTATAPGGPQRELGAAAGEDGVWRGAPMRT